MTQHEPSLGQRLLQEGQQLLAQGDRAGAAQVLARARDERDTVLAAHALIEATTWWARSANMMGLPAPLRWQDDIFGFFAGHPSSRNPLRDYLADGWRTLSELMLLLEAVDQPLLKTPRVLEFASGHGRFTRHFVKALGADRVVVSDVVPDAVEFALRTFGVDGFRVGQRARAGAVAAAVWSWCLCCRCSATCRAAPGRAGSRCCGMRWRRAGCWCFSTHGGEGRGI